MEDEDGRRRRTEWREQRKRKSGAGWRCDAVVVRRLLSAEEVQVGAAVIDTGGVGESASAVWMANHAIDFQYGPCKRALTA